jgi:hypothetical protein
MAHVFDGPIGDVNAQETRVVRGAGSDFGDSYWADGKQRSLVRLDDQLVVAVRATENAQSAFERIAADGGVLARFQQESEVGANVRIYAGKGIEPVDSHFVRAALADAPEVAWTAPVFQSAETGKRLIVTYRIVVAVNSA